MWRTAYLRALGDERTCPMMTFRILATTACASLVATTACLEKPGRASVELTDSAGVRILVYPNDDRLLQWQFDALWEVGGANDSRLQLVELGNHHVVVDLADNILLLDEVGSRVFVISKAGEFLRTFGRRGEGPGELKVPSALAVDRNGTVSVYDIGKQSLVRWGPTGSLASEVRIPVSFWGPKIRTTAEDTALFAALPNALAQSDEQMLMEWTPAGGRALARLERLPDRMADFPTCGFNGIEIPPLFAPELVWDAAVGRVALNVWPEYRIDVLGNGGPLLSIRRDTPMRKVSASDALREVAEGMPIAVVDCTVPAQEVVRGRGYADVLPAVADLMLAPNGDLWVSRGRFKGEAATVDIYANDGSYKGTLPADSPFPAAFLSSGEFVAIEHDPREVPRLVLYRVVSS